MSTDMVFYDGQTTVVDRVTPTGLGVYSNQTKSDLEKRFGPLQIVALDEAVKRISLASCKAPVEIDREAWDDALSVLPPLKWVCEGELESFRAHEGAGALVHVSYVRIGKRFFELKRPLADSHDELVGAVTIMLSTKSRKR